MRKKIDMKHQLREMMEQRRNGIKCGIASYCSANDLVLEAAMQRALKRNMPVLIEATANQVNQFGGYSDMRPIDFYDKVMRLATQMGVPQNLVILGGDHLGPLTWQNESEAEAMEKSKTLVYDYVRAGFTKIHLDTSMKLADDPEGALSNVTIAKRGVILYQTAMSAFKELKKERPDALRPVFIVGSEVPIPGGAQAEEDTLAVTKPEAFEDTVAIYRACFEEAGIPSGFEDVIAIVVQPGVEFGDEKIFYYCREKAEMLSNALKRYPSLCFEGHSTDYQTRECLRQMVEDGFAILKVGPALTFGLREALFSLSQMERELVPEAEQTHLEQVLERVMQENPSHWRKHYHGNEGQLYLARKYSFSDRSRYYINLPEVVNAIEQLFDRLRTYPIPMNMLHQYMPRAYEKIRIGELVLDPKALALDGIVRFMEDYEYATGYKVDHEV